MLEVRNVSKTYTTGDFTQVALNDVSIAFRDNEFANPEGLVGYVAKQGRLAKVRPDMRVVFIDDFETVEQRLKATRRLLTDLARIAERKKSG